LALAAELPASVLADLTGISVGTAERWSQWAKRDWAAYVGQRTADDRRGIGSQKLTRPRAHLAPRARHLPPRRRQDGSAGHQRPDHPARPGAAERRRQGAGRWNRPLRDLDTDPEYRTLRISAL